MKLNIILHQKIQTTVYIGRKSKHTTHYIKITHNIHEKQRQLQHHKLEMQVLQTLLHNFSHKLTSVFDISDVGDDDDSQE